VINARFFILTSIIILAAVKVEHFAKTTGAKIAKVGLKLYSTGLHFVAKFAKFIPGIGTGVGKAIDGASIAANKASDAIHVKLPKFAQKGMNALDKAQEYSSLPKKAGAAGFLF
jgi:hypothetical protein